MICWGGYLGKTDHGKGSTGGVNQLTHCAWVESCMPVVDSGIKFVYHFSRLNKSCL